MRIGLWIGSTGLWAFVVGLVCGPMASWSEVSSWWMGGILLVVALWYGWTCARDWWHRHQVGAPFESNAGFFVGLVLLAVLVPFAMAWDALRESWLGDLVGGWRAQWRAYRRKSKAIHGQGELLDRAKALEGTAPRMRF